MKKIDLMLWGIKTFGGIKYQLNLGVSSQRQNGFFGFFSVEVVLRVTKANQASPRSKMGRSLQW